MKTKIILLILVCFLCKAKLEAASLLGVCLDDSFRITNPNAGGCAGHVYFPKFNKKNGKTKFYYRVDRGSIGDIGDEEANSAVSEILSKWSNQANIKFIRKGSGRLASDINATNYASILSPSSPLGYNAIIWDENGEILDDAFGLGAKEFIFGFAGATFYNSKGTRITSIKEANSLFNGFLFKNSVLGSGYLDNFKTTILHEFAHMFGLDHTQTASLNYFFDENLDEIPIMFPVGVNPNPELLRDDIASIKEAYNSRESNRKNFGRIEGFLVRNGVPLTGMNITVYNKNDGGAINAISSPVDINGKGRGKFILPNISPGSNYFLRVEKILLDFTEGSSVGIHAPNTDPSIEDGFFLGENEDASNLFISDDLLEGANRAELFSISARETRYAFIDIGTNHPLPIPELSTAPKSFTRSFYLKGSAIDKPINLATQAITKKIKITSSNNREKTIVLETSYADLISFSPNNFSLNKKNKSRIVTVTIAPIADFNSVFGAADTDILIGLRVTETRKNFTDKSESLLLRR